MRGPVVNQGFELVRQTAMLEAWASHHAANGQPEVAAISKRNAASYQTTQQRRLETEASIRRTIRELAHW